MARIQVHNRCFHIPLALLGGLGVGEAGFQGISLLFGSNKGSEGAILFHAVFFIFAIGLGGLLYLFSNLSDEKQEKQFAR